MITDHKKLLFVQRILRQTQHGGVDREDVSKAMCIVGDFIIEKLENEIGVTK